MARVAFADGSAAGPREGVVLVEAVKPPPFALAHALQRELGRLVAPLWIWLVTFYLRWGRGYRIEGFVNRGARSGASAASTTAPS